jgi:hypothetical protein
MKLDERCVKALPAPVPAKAAGRRQGADTALHAAEVVVTQAGRRRLRLSAALASEVESEDCENDSAVDELLGAVVFVPPKDSFIEGTRQGAGNSAIQCGDDRATGLAMVAGAGLPQIWPPVPKKSRGFPPVRAKPNSGGAGGFGDGFSDDGGGGNGGGDGDGDAEAKRGEPRKGSDRRR